MADPELVSIVVVTWNSEETVSACLDSILAQDWPRLETLVIENGSRDRTRAILEPYEGIRTVLCDRNRGFALACNIGIGLSQGDYVLLLNADTVLAADFLTKIVPELRARPEVGSATGKILRTGGGPTRIDSTGIILNRCLFSPCDRGEGMKDVGQYDGLDNVFGPTGAAALYRRLALEDVRINGEYLDEDFFAYYEDVDLAWRMQLRGWESIYVPEALVWHRRKGPRAQPVMVAARSFCNRYFCYVKNELRANLRDYSLWRVLREIARALWCLVRYPYIILGVPRALLLLPRMLKKRREIQEIATSPAEHMSRF